MATSPLTQPLLVNDYVCSLGRDLTRPNRGRAEDFVGEWEQLRAQGVSYREIGEAYGFSHERVRQLAGHIVPGPKPAMVRRQLEARKVARWLYENGPVTPEQLEIGFGMTQRGLLRLDAHVPGVIPLHLVVAGPRSTESHYSTDEMVEALQEVWTRVPETNRHVGLSHKRYNQARTSDHPCAPAIINRFGSWESACAAAEVPAGGKHCRPKDTYVRQWTDEQILDIIAGFVADCALRAVRPSYAEYERRQKEDEARPSGSTVRNRMRLAGTPNWPSILTLALRRDTLAA